MPAINLVFTVPINSKINSNMASLPDLSLTEVMPFFFSVTRWVVQMANFPNIVHAQPPTPQPFVNELEFFKVSSLSLQPFCSAVA